MENKLKQSDNMIGNIRSSIFGLDPGWNRPSEQVACEISIPKTITWSHLVILYSYCSRRVVTRTKY